MLKISQCNTGNVTRVFTRRNAMQRRTDTVEWRKRETACFSALQYGYDGDQERGYGREELEIFIVGQK